MGCSQSTSTRIPTAALCDASVVRMSPPLVPLPAAAATTTTPLPPSSTTDADFETASGTYRSQLARREVQTCLRAHAAPSIADPLATLCVAYMRAETDACRWDRDAIVPTDGAAVDADACVCGTRCASCSQRHRCVGRTDNNDVRSSRAVANWQSVACVGVGEWLCGACLSAWQAQQARREAEREERRLATGDRHQLTTAYADASRLVVAQSSVRVFGERTFPSRGGEHKETARADVQNAEAAAAAAVVADTRTPRLGKLDNRDARDHERR